ncbi:MAG: hypothetical protein HYT03_01325 [Candidatus Harrisonbacteria bacterium]|nr:hypothetical protein [Candidatus Harrisonbacteria bacterium]
MAKRKFAGKIAKEILIAMAVLSAAAGITITLAVMPGLGRVGKEIFDWYYKQNKSRRQRIRKTFQDLRKERLIEEKHLPDGSTQFILSEKGKNKILHYNFDDLKIAKTTKWDKIWRIVIFDIPNNFEKERRLWRFKLKTIGFYQLQKSVWVYPYPCRKEIDFIAEYLGISPHIRIVEAVSVDGSEELNDYFFKA